MTQSRLTGAFGLVIRLLVATTIVAPVTAAAQQEMSPVDSIVQPQAHPFLDRQNLLLTGGVISAAIADAITTLRNQHRYPQLFRETNPFARPLVEKGWPGMSALLAMDSAAELGVRYLFHRKNHHRLERWTPVVPIALHVFGAIYNTRELRRADRSMSLRGVVH